MKSSAGGTSWEKALKDEERLGALLLDRGLLSEPEFELVRRQSRATGISLWRLVLSLNLVSPEAIHELLAAVDGKPRPTASASIAATAGKPTQGGTQGAGHHGPVRQILADALAAGNLPALVEKIFGQACMTRASDVHFDPQEDGRLRIRYRIDGQLHDVLFISAAACAAVVSRVKVMANMNILERRDAQDGHIVQPIAGKDRNFRIATVPTHLGERLVARIMDDHAVSVGLDRVGMMKEQLDCVSRLLRRPHGVLIVTGPVGSGKTTTLYSCLQRINHPSRNIMTIEDPVEYTIAGVNQLQVDPKIDWTFPKALRAMLRQDPDVMMIGEIRDDETARIAVRASLTGDLVLTSMHANDSAAAVGMLYNYSIPGYLISTSVLGVVSQRLVRTINPAAVEEYEADQRLRELLGLQPDERPGLRLKRGKGSADDMGTGYLGRTGVFEVMEVNDLLRDLIFKEAPKDVIRKEALDHGMTPMNRHAVQKVIDGVTTIEEIFRVGLIEWTTAGPHDVG